MMNEPNPGLPTSGHAACMESERRRAARYAPVEDRLWLGWWSTPSDFQIVGARLLNISRTGAAVAVAVSGAPIAESVVWLRLETLEAIASVQARIIAVSDCADVPEATVRMRFTDRCPEIFFGIAVRGEEQD